MFTVSCAVALSFYIFSCHLCKILYRHYVTITYSVCRTIGSLKYYTDDPQLKGLHSIQKRTNWNEVLPFVPHSQNIWHEVRDGQILMLDTAASIFLSAFQLQKLICRMLQDLMCNSGEYSSEITHKINLTLTVLWIELRIRLLSNRLRCCMHNHMFGKPTD